VIRTQAPSLSGIPSTGPTSDQSTVIAADDAGVLPAQMSVSNPAASTASTQKVAASNPPATAFPPLIDPDILMTNS
jgi:hypothetical protein